MHDFDVPHFLGLLALMLVSAKVVAAIARRFGQPAVLGELVAGVLLGTSVFGLIDPTNQILHMLSELGVVILLFEIGLETDIRQLLRVGGSSAVVAIVGVVVPFALGFGVCRLLSFSDMVGIVCGASLTATSVGITARVLSDLGRLQDQESQIILGAAVIDDVIGLVILAVVTGLTRGQEVSLMGIFKTTGRAFGFLLVALLIGKLLVPRLLNLIIRADAFGSPTTLALILSFAFAWLASLSGSAMIIGAFAAGVLICGTTHAQQIEKGVAHLGHFFVPIFFLTVGAAVDVRVLNPVDPANRQTLMVASLLIVAAVIGKFVAGYAPLWFRGNKRVIGVGMIPRGEVGLIFAQMGLTTGVFDSSLFSAITLMVMVTTFIAPPLLKIMLPPTSGAGVAVELDGIAELTTEP